MPPKPLETGATPRSEYRRVLDELAAKATGSARANKAPQAAYAVLVRRYLVTLFEELDQVEDTDAAYAERALEVSGFAERACPQASLAEAWMYWAASVYARRIYRAWEHARPLHVRLDWLHDHPEIRALVPA